MSSHSLPKLSRRTVLRAGATGVAGTIGAALNLPWVDAVVAQDEAPGASLIGPLEGPTYITDPTQFPTTYNEAPQLAELVAKGELPPVAERIGLDPLVVQPLHEIGKYGGTWRRGFTGPGDKWNGYRTCGYDMMLGWAVNGQEAIPNMAKGWEFSADGRSMDLFLRRGMHWSDGHPFTADDFVFWYEDMFSNDEFMPAKTVAMVVNGTSGRVSKVDETTVRFEFDDPYFLLTDRLASQSQSVDGVNGHGFFAPAHYLKRFHPTYAAKADLDAEIAAAGVDNWVVLLKMKNDWALNPELPVLTAWKTTSPINTPTFTLERNPYSIWVDTAGNQLPYLDDIVMTLAENIEVINLRAIAGDYDFQARHIDIAKLPIILENRESGDYSVYLDTGDYGSDIHLTINQTYVLDEEVGKWLGTTDFRRALSLGIQRDQINETFLLGTGVSGSPVPSDNNRYNPGPEYRTLWSTYDPDQANQLLDGIGLTAKDGDGFRQRLDGGGRLRIEAVTTSGQFMPFTQICEVISEDLKAIGIELIVREVERGLSDTMVAANEVQIYVWNNDGSENVFLSPKAVIPRGADTMGPLYGLWFGSNGAEGMEPPDHLKAAMEKYQQGQTATVEERTQLGKELWANAIDQVYAIGVVGLSAASMGIRLVKNYVGNNPARQYSSPLTRNPGNSCPPTFYYKE